MAKTYLERIHETQKEIDKLTAELKAIEAAYSTTVGMYKDRLDELKHDLKHWIGCYEKSLEPTLDDYQSPLDTERILDRVTRNGYITAIKF